MPARNGLRRRLNLIPVVALATVAVTAASAAAQAPGLPRSYNATRIDSPTPVAGGAFGWGVYSSDLTGDGKHDLLVAQSQVGTATEPNKVFIFNGVDGALVDTITPPEDNPLSATGAYQSPEMAFVYIETMPDLGSCPGGDGPDADRICDQPAVAPGDGIPEILVGSRALRVNQNNGTAAPTNADRPVGRGYVLDGATRAVLKRIDMPVADRQQNQRFAGSPAFARSISSPQGMPPCAGSRAENNDAGVGPCPSEAAYPRAVRIGDLNGGGQPDIVITARGFPESGDVIRNDGTVIPGTAPAGTECRNNVRRQPAPTVAVPDPPVPAPATCSAGKAWVYAGEAIGGSNPQTILETAIQSMKNPDAQIGGGEFGGNVWRVGDVTGPGSTGATALPDGVPDFIIPARSHDIPLKNPDPNAGLNVGAAYLYSGSSAGAENGVLRATIVSPEPQVRSQFSGNFNAGRAVGDLGATSTPDILLPAPMQNVGGNADEGKAWILNGDTTAGGGGEQSWNFGMLTDPEPYIGGNFGGGITGVGDLVSGAAAPANEVLIGGFRFDTFTEASQNTVPDVNFMNGTLNRNLMTIPHPEGTTGDGFGVGLTPMGDLNDDGFLDFSVSAYIADIPLGGQGRAWIFKSDNSPPPAPPTKAAPVPDGPTTPQSQGETLRAGPCANRMIGTNIGDRLMGSLAGDEIFGFDGDDTIRGFAGRDCVDGQGGNDALAGDDDNDKVIGGSGADRVSGGDGRDELFGGIGDDRLDGDTENDMVAGGAGNDRVLGSAGNDRLYGEAGRDRIVGGGGRNIIDGGTGNDSIEARNGERDRIACGTGRDRVRADRFDRLNSCETVSYGGRITNRGALPPRTTSAARARSASTSGKGETSR